MNWFIYHFFALNCIFFNAESKPFELGLQSFFTWRHGVHIGVPKLWSGGHVGFPNKSFRSSTLFSWKLTISFVDINLHKCWPPVWPEWKRSINISPCVPVFVYQVYLLTSSVFNGVLNYLVRRCYLCLSFISATCYNVNNCTSPINGICRRTDECRCHDGYIGNEGLNRSVKDLKAALCTRIVHVYVGTHKKKRLVIQWVQNLRVETTTRGVCDGKGALIKWFSISLCLQCAFSLCSFKFDFMHAATVPQSWLYPR